MTGSPSSHVKVFLGKTLDPKTPLVQLLECKRLFRGL